MQFVDTACRYSSFPEVAKTPILPVEGMKLPRSTVVPMLEAWTYLVNDFVKNPQVCTPQTSHGGGARRGIGGGWVAIKAE